MGVSEIIGYSQFELPSALDLMESSLEMGQKAKVTLCTQALPTEADLADIYLGMIRTGCHVSYPTARVIEGVPTTAFDIRKGSPQWGIIIPVLIPIFTIGVIAFGIAKIEAIGKVLVPLILVAVGGIIILAVVLRKPAEKYIEAGGGSPSFLRPNVPVSWSRGLRTSGGRLVSGIKSYLNPSSLYSPMITPI